jgi:hypothetical protein
MIIKFIILKTAQHIYIRDYIVNNKAYTLSFGDLRYLLHGFYFSISPTVVVKNI